MSRGKTMKLLVFTPYFFLKKLRGINNDKNDNKYNNTNTRKNKKMQHKIRQNLKGQNKTSRRLKVKTETE